MLLSLLAVLLTAIPLAAQEEDRAAEFYALINQARLNEGLPPYSLADELVTSAQRHADDLATHGLDSHIGSDGSTKTQRIAEAGYSAWGDGAMVGENFWIGYGTVQEALDWFMDDPSHRDNILSSRYREVGIGVASDAQGRFYYVLDFGARPNVLPIFISDGLATTESAQVAIRLSNEEAYPQGQGTLYIGRAIEVRISNTFDFAGRPWQAWEELVAWALPEEPGEHTVYVQFRDGAGRTTTSADAILLLPGAGTPTPAPPTATPTPGPTDTPAPMLSPTETPTSVPSPTRLPTTPPVPPSSPTPLSVAVVAPAPFLTWTPLPPATAPSASGGLGPLVGLLCVLQAVTALLGAYLALRRRPS